MQNRREFIGTLAAIAMAPLPEPDVFAMQEFGGAIYSNVGYFDNLMVFDSALTPEEVRLLAEGPTNGNYHKLCSEAVWHVELGE